MQEWTEQEIEERAGAFFYPDSTVAAEYYEGISRRAALDPSRKLMLAVLEDALKCFLTNLSARSGKGKQLFDEAEQWIMEMRGEGVFSFDNICEALGMNPQYLRQGLRRWQRQGGPERSGEKAAA